MYVLFINVCLICVCLCACVCGFVVHVSCAHVCVRACLCPPFFVPVPKKGGFTKCDNWRGISLLDIMGKLFGKALQKRLQELAEKLLSDSQCGFHSGRGCVDLIFSA